MEKIDRLNQMYEYACTHNFCKNKKTFAALINMNEGNLSSAFSGKDMRYLTNNLLLRINTALGDVFNPAWVLYGTGEMLKESAGAAESRTLAEEQPQADSLPLIPIDAVAGFNGIDVQGVRLENCTRYVVPEFADLHAEFMIRVSGSSMYPKYSSGDLLACRRITEVSFLQWGKVYVLDSNQGAMVKRLFPCEDDADKVECRSDNPNYPPFCIAKSEIRSVSIVVGAIRFE